MRKRAPVSVFLTLPLVALLGACATATAPEPRPVTVSRIGALQVHPELINPTGQYGQAEAAAAIETTALAAATVGERQTATPQRPRPKADPGLRRQRSIYFDYRASEIRDEFLAVLQAHAQYLARNPNARIRLEGNADERASPSYNLRLALQRADSVRRALLDQGVQSQQIRVVSLGAINPRLAGHDEQSWAENRRTDIVYD